MKRGLFSVLILLGGTAPSLLLAEGESIPQPLTLQQAIEFAVAHPETDLLESSAAQARIVLEEAQESQAMTVDLQGRIRWKTLQQQTGTKDDHQFSLVAKKPVYDFGRSAMGEEIDSHQLMQREQIVEDALQQRKLEIMERFFAVLLADRQRTVEDETMTIAFLRFKKKQDKEVTGDYSELDLLKAESRFQDARAKQKQSEMMQRMTRIQLAEAMNRPGEIPSQLVPPIAAPEQIFEQLEPLEALIQATQLQSPSVQQQQQAVEVAKRMLGQAQMGDHPALDAAFEVLDHSRVTSSKDRWRASLLLEVPLLDGGENGRQVAAARETLRQARAKLEMERRKVTETVHQLYLEMETLKAQWQADRIAEEYRDIELDRNRALYEQERQSNFGDSLIGVSASHLRSAKSRFAVLMLRAKLDRLTGKEIVINE